MRASLEVLVLAGDAPAGPELAAMTDVVRAAGLHPVEEPGGDVVLLDGRHAPESTLVRLGSLRSAPDYAGRPIVVIFPSAHARGESGEQAFALGADDVLAEDVGPGELAARLRARQRARGDLGALAEERNDARALLSLTQKLTSFLDVREILYTVVQRIADVVQVERASIVLVPDGDPGVADDVGYVVVTSDDAGVSNLQLDLAKYPEIREVLRSRQPLTIADASTHPVLDAVRGDDGQSQPGSLSLFPLVHENHAVGVLFLRGAQRGELRERDAKLCQTVANATAVALRNARVMQALRDRTQQVTFARFEAERRLGELRRYADLFASAAEGIAVVSSTGHLLFANPRSYEMVGVAEKDVEGLDAIELVHPDDRPRTEDLWAGFARGEYPRGVDLRLRRGVGDYIVVSCSFASLGGEGDGAVLISFHDVTEQRRTEAEFVKTMEFLESLIDASVDGILAADEEGNVILFNQSAERIYGYRAEEVVGRLSMDELFPRGGAEDVRRRVRDARWGGSGRLEPTRVHALGRDGEPIPIRLSAAMIYERGEPVATFGIFTDLRDQLRTEERLAEAQQKLADTEKQALIAELAGTAAHELNQPLTSVMAYAELLKRKLPGETPEHRAASTMLREAERMADIVRKIGKMTKYETKSYVGRQKILDLDKASDRRG